MIKKFAFFLGQDGYMKMNTSVPECALYFKKENGFVSLVELVCIDDNPYLTDDIIDDVNKKAKWRFIDQGLEEIHTIIIGLSTDVERARSFQKHEDFYWIVDTKERKLYVDPEKAEDFYGFRGQIEKWIVTEINVAAVDDAIYDAKGRKRKSVMDQPLVNHFVFAVNMLVFTFCTLSGDLLYNYGELRYENVISGEYYRMITALFLHGSVTHLAGNMLMLFVMGNVVEKEMGHIKYFILYFGSGLLGAAASLYVQYLRFSSGQEVYASIGASGALFGIMGGFLWVLLRNRGRASGMSFIRVLLLIFYSLYRGLQSTNVDNAAHFGGLFAGFLIAVLIYRKRQQDKNGKENTQ